MNLPKGVPPSRRVTAPPFTGVRGLKPHVVAETVHRAVCEITGTDGFGHCYLYANLGWMLLLQLGATSKQFTVNAGSLYLRPNPDDECEAFAFVADDAAVERGEFHAWIIGIEGPTIIDLSALHYPRYVQDTETESGSRVGLRWGRGEPPRYLWDASDKIPSWVTFSADRNAIDVMASRLTADLKDFKEYRKLTLNIYERMKYVA